MESIPSNARVLVVDDDAGLLLSIKASLVSSGMPEPALVSDPLRVMDILGTHDFHVALLDLIMPGVNGLDLLRQIKQNHPHVECVIATAVDDVATAVQAMNYGAYDYLVKPLERERLMITIERARERYNLRRGLSLFERRPSFSGLKSPEAFRAIVTEDESMIRVFHQVEAVSPTDYNVVISGESGTGKEELARIIHRLSLRSQGPFTAVNMAAFTATLLDDSFFGHCRGAFTGAVDDKPGFFEAARGGTLFLDEITELQPELQGKFLRAIQEKKIYSLGCTRPRDIDVRIVSATNRDIHARIQEGAFRADLFYRLNMSHIRIPPLRERKKDILPLSRHFLEIHARKNAKPIRTISLELAERLQAYEFPGNIRELENIIASGVLMEHSNALTPAACQGFPAGHAEPLSASGTFQTLDEIERQHIFRALDRTGGNRTQAARLLGISLRTLQRKLK